ncbi:MAG: aspartate aminotransferase family protein [Alphaproteobacteria bacterium]|jgi:4-aminobutyrate--pyruvate transaminase|nr:aspartate aminotransferase family protein [Alphaproteobacteria bacterium]MDP6816161.1 aspartate aminotransferase family protein [Alphaproteobacteria bacterium]
MTDRGNSPASRDIAHYLHPYTNLAVHEQSGPHIVTRGRGIYVTDDAGKEYIEGLAGLWCASFGFGEEELVDAATKQMRELPYYHGFAGKSVHPAIDLAELMKEIAPVPFSKVFFANSGSEANDTAVKMVWYFNNARGRPEKKKFISRLRGYHGVTVAAGSLTGLPYAQKDFDLPLDFVRHTMTPDFYRGAEDGESEEDFASRCAQALEDMIVEEGPETVAAFIAEPVMGAGGVILPPRTYFEKVQAVLKKYEVLMIADEVICGFGRTGNMWGSQSYHIKPDILTCAKALSSAYLPISAVMITDEIYQAFRTNSEKLGIFGHGYTYTAHPACAAVALRAQQLMQERDILGHVRAVAPRFQARIQGFADHPLVGHARGVGLIGALEVVADKDSKRSFDPAAKIGALVQQTAQDHGLIVRALPGDIVGFCPPLIITEAEVDEMFDRFTRALDEMTRQLKQQGATAAQ